MRADDIQLSGKLISNSLEEARRVIKNYQLTWPKVMSGKGDDDPIWKMFGGMADNQLLIPLYVLVDQEGRLRYREMAPTTFPKYAI